MFCRIISVCLNVVDGPVQKHESSRSVISWLSNSLFSLRCIRAERCCIVCGRAVRTPGSQHVDSLGFFFIFHTYFNKGSLPNQVPTSKSGDSDLCKSYPSTNPVLVSVVSLLLTLASSPTK